MNNAPIKIRYKLVIAYDGTDLSGWQIQKHDTSIQQLVEQAVQMVSREEKVRVIGSGRTDAGVHALAQVAHFTCHARLDKARFVRSMNGLLPAAIRILDIQEVPLTFHAQRSATSKIYHYHLYLDPVLLPFDKKYVSHIRKPLDIALLKEATAYFIGTHDFSAFANAQHEGAAKKNPVRTIYSIQVIPTEHGVRLEFHGNGFLYKMVRNIVGILLDVATKKRPLHEIGTILASKDRKKAPKAAEAKGLFLASVYYPEEALLLEK